MHSKNVARGWSRFPTLCSAWSWRTSIRCWPTFRERCARILSASCPEIAWRWSFRRTIFRVVGLCTAISRKRHTQKGNENESQGLCKENLHEVQSRSSARRGARDLCKREAPPASGLETGRIRNGEHCRGCFSGVQGV